MNRALKSLKTLKRDHVYNIYSNNIINNSNKFKLMLNILNCILSHRCRNEIFNRSIIIPIVKDKRKPDVFLSNYRAISLCLVLCKILEYLILDSLSELLQSDEYQFAYKENHSTVLCTSMVLNTIEYYKSYNSNVFACF